MIAYLEAANSLNFAAAVKFVSGHDFEALQDLLEASGMMSTVAPILHDTE